MKKFQSIGIFGLLLAASATAQQPPQQQQSMPDMPDMQMPNQKEKKSVPPEVNPPGTPGLQMRPGAVPNKKVQEEVRPTMQMGMEHMDMQSPANVASDVTAVQEPENPHVQTGSYPPAPDLLAEARQAAPKKLEEFEQLALQSNPTLKQAELLARSSAGLAKQAGLWPNPSIGYEGSEIRGGSFRGGEQGGFIQQDIVLGGKLRLRRDAYEQQRKADEIGIEEQKLNILGGVRVQFFSALTAQESVKVRGRLLRLALDASATAHQLANVGQADAPDVLETEVEAEQAKIDFESAQRRYIQAYGMLAAIAGQPKLPLTMLAGDLEHPPEINPDQLLQTIMENSPSVKKAEQEARQAESVLKRNRREAVPDLTLRVGEQQNNEQSAGARPVGLQSFATASIQVPIFNRNQGNVESSRAELERAQNEVARVRLNLAQMAQPMVQEYLANQSQVQRYRTQMLPRAQRAYELYLNKYRNMAAAYPEVVIAQRTFFQLQERYVESLGQLWTVAEQLQNYLLTNGLKPAGRSGGAQ